MNKFSIEITLINQNTYEAVVLKYMRFGITMSDVLDNLYRNEDVQEYIVKRGFVLIDVAIHKEEMR